MDSEQKISDRVLKVKNYIEERKDWQLQDLQNFYNNALNDKKITDYEKEIITELCEKIITERFPKKNSRKMLNNKSSEAKILLEEVYNDLIKSFDLSKNNVKNGVKPGGYMIGGQMYVDWYISYKNDEKFNTGFCYLQKSQETEPYIEVNYRKVGSDLDEKKNFPIALKDEALSLFKNHLLKIINKNS
jgi:transcriptional regulator of heat shock response